MDKLMDKLNGHAELAKALLANIVIVGPFLLWVLSLYIENVMQAHAAQPHMGAATKEDVAEISAQVGQQRVLLESNGAIAALVQAQDQANHASQEKKLDDMAEAIKEIQRLQVEIFREMQRQ